MYIILIEKKFIWVYASSGLDSMIAEQRYCAWNSSLELIALSILELRDPPVFAGIKGIHHYVQDPAYVILVLQCIIANYIVHIAKTATANALQNGVLLF